MKPNNVKISNFKFFSAKWLCKSMLCEPCITENQLIQATHFCRTCNDPELLCESCAKHHTKQKPFKGHQLSKDIGDFRKRYLAKSVTKQILGFTYIFKRNIFSIKKDQSLMHAYQ